MRMVAKSTEAMTSLCSMLPALGLTEVDLALTPVIAAALYVLALHALALILRLFKSDGTA